MASMRLEPSLPRPGSLTNMTWTAFHGVCLLNEIHRVRPDERRPCFWLQSILASFRHCLVLEDWPMKLTALKTALWLKQISESGESRRYGVAVISPGIWNRYHSFQDPCSSLPYPGCGPLRPPSDSDIMHRPFNIETALIVSLGTDINQSTPIPRAAVVAPG
jgi:hypothetical protein